MDQDEPLSLLFNAKFYLSFLGKYKKYVLAIIVFSFLFELSFTLDNLIYKFVIDEAGKFIAGSLAQQLFFGSVALFTALFVTILFFRTIGNWLKLHVLNRLTTNMLVDVRYFFFNHIVDLSYGFHTSRKTGTLISRLGRGSHAVDNLNDIITFNTLPIVFQILTVSFALLYFDVLSAILALTSALLFVSVSVFMQVKFFKPQQALANEADDAEKAFVADSFTNIDSIKYFAKEDFVKKKFKSYRLKTARGYLKLWDYYRWMSAFQDVIISFTWVSLLLIALFKVSNGSITVGTVVFMASVYGNLTGALYNFVGGIRNFYRSIIDFDSLSRYARLTNEVVEPQTPEDFSVLKGEVEFSGVDFSYGGKVIFKDFSLKIPAGKKVALVGRSGSGKTTIVKLLFRLYDVQKGSVTVDGVDVRSVKKEHLRRGLSIVPQDCALFDDTIYNNIHFSNPSASRSDVFRAMKASDLWEFVKSLPDRENTIVGERGVKLSGGEKQRVSIARALLADKRVLVLDEATSSLDSKTEFDIQRSLERLMHARTSIIIAHRLSTVMKADLIIVLDKGKVIQTGSHEELLRQGGKYKELWDLQKGGYLVDA